MSLEYIRKNVHTAYQHQYFCFLISSYIYFISDADCSTILIVFYSSTHLIYDFIVFAGVRELWEQLRGLCPPWAVRFQRGAPLGSQLIAGGVDLWPVPVGSHRRILTSGVLLYTWGSSDFSHATLPYGAVSVCSCF